MKRIFVFLLSLAAVIIGLSFAVLNNEKVVLNYYFGKEEFTLSVVIVVVLVFGVLLATFVNLTQIIKLKYEITSLKKQLKVKDQEISNLRSIPLNDKH